MNSNEDPSSTSFPVLTIYRVACRKEFISVDGGGQPGFSDSIEFEGRGVNKRIKSPEFIYKAAGVPKTNLG